MTSRPLCRSSPGLEARTPSLGAAVALAPLTGRLATASDDPKNVGFTPQSEETLLIGRRAVRHSAITYEFSVRGACAEKRTSFPG
jgi:hypothetical protein